MGNPFEALDRYWNSLQSWIDEYRECDTELLQKLNSDNREVLAKLAENPTRDEYINWLAQSNGRTQEFCEHLVRAEHFPQACGDRARKVVDASQIVLDERQRAATEETWILGSH